MASIVAARQVERKYCEKTSWTSTAPVDGGLFALMSAKFHQRQLLSEQADPLFPLNIDLAMVQGKTKGLQSKAPNPRHAQKAATNLKKGRVAIPPKKAPLVKQDKLRKVRKLVAFLGIN